MNKNTAYFKRQGLILLSERNKSNLSLQEISEKSGLTQVKIVTIEAGLYVYRKSLLKLLSFYNIDPHVFTFKVMFEVNENFSYDYYVDNLDALKQSFDIMKVVIYEDTPRILRERFIKRLNEVKQWNLIYLPFLCI